MLILSERGFRVRVPDDGILGALERANVQSSDCHPRWLQQRGAPALSRGTTQCPLWWSSAEFGLPPVAGRKHHDANHLHRGFGHRVTFGVYPQIELRRASLLYLAVLCVPDDVDNLLDNNYHGSYPRGNHCSAELS